MPLQHVAYWRKRENVTHSYELEVCGFTCRNFWGGRGVVCERVTARIVREFPSLPRVEGIAVTPESRTFYVTDEDESVHLRLTRLLVG